MQRCPVYQVIVFLLLGDEFDAAVVGLGNFASDCITFGVFCFELILLANYRRVKRIPLFLNAVLIYWPFIDRSIRTMLSARQRRKNCFGSLTCVRWYVDSSINIVGIFILRFANR